MKVAVIHGAMEDFARTVALVEVAEGTTDIDACEIAFTRTNSIDCGWWENEGVTPMFGGKTCRSTTVGDMVLVGTTKYICKMTGWSEV